MPDALPVYVINVAYFILQSTYSRYVVKVSCVVFTAGIRGKIEGGLQYEEKLYMSVS